MECYTKTTPSDGNLCYLTAFYLPKQQLLSKSFPNTPHKCISTDWQQNMSSLVSNYDSYLGCVIGTIW